MPLTLPSSSDLLESENQFLKQTISALREELERIGDEHEDAQQKVHARNEKEKNQLKSLINELRDSLDSNRNEHN